MMEASHTMRREKCDDLTDDGSMASHFLDGSVTITVLQVDATTGVDDHTDFESLF